MPDTDRYITLRGEGMAVLEERRSRFIGTAAPVRDEASAVAFVRRIAADTPDATHHVFAYRLAGGAHAKYSDDGEPQGTAGAPVLDIIKKSGGDDIAVVVTRYFGGVKLGAGGLVRAYAEAAKRAITAAGLAEYRLYTEFALSCDYAEHRLLAARLPARGVRIDDCVFGERVTLRCAAPAAEFSAAAALLSELSGGRLSPTVTGSRYDTEE